MRSRAGDAVSAFNETGIGDRQDRRWHREIFSDAKATSGYRQNRDGSCTNTSRDSSTSLGMTSITWRLTQPCEGQGRRPRKVIDPEQNSERRELRDVASRSDLGLFAW